ncbi:MAG: hypothetical protein ACTSUX_00965 [Promethearchaeota archaeon]
MVDITYLTQTIANLFEIPIAIIMTFILLGKLLKEHSETGEWNTTRFIMLGIFTGYTITVFWGDLYEIFAPLNFLSYELAGNTLSIVNIFSIGVGIIVCFALSLIAHAYNIEWLLYTPFFIFIGMLFIYFYTGYYEMYTIYLYIGAIIGLLFFFIIGFNLRDNSALGLGIFFFFSFMTIITGEGLFSQILQIAYSLFGIYFVLGRFRPFKEKLSEEVKN